MQMSMWTLRFHRKCIVIAKNSRFSQRFCIFNVASIVAVANALGHYRQVARSSGRSWDRDRDRSRGSACGTIKNLWCTWQRRQLQVQVCSWGLVESCSESWTKNGAPTDFPCVLDGNGRNENLLQFADLNRSLTTQESMPHRACDSGVWHFKDN